VKNRVYRENITDGAVLDECFYRLCACKETVRQIHAQKHVIFPRGGHHPAHFGRVSTERLLTKNRLSRVERRQRLLRMQGAGRGDDDAVARHSQEFVQIPNDGDPGSYQFAHLGRFLRRVRNRNGVGCSASDKRLHPVSSDPSDTKKSEARPPSNDQFFRMKAL
jgi:hypothetical protein